MVEVDNHGGAGAYLLSQKLNGRLALTEPLRTNTRVCLAVIPSVEEVLQDLGMFAFVALHLFSAGRRHSSAVAELLRLINILEELHTKLQGKI